MTAPDRDIRRLLDIMVRLRDPEAGCPWDVEQTFATIAPYTIEEAYEVADAIDRNDLGDLRDELGDLLLQVVFHARMAQEQGAFDFDDVVAAISDKMVRRHPHVFGDEAVADAGAQTVAWEEHKRREREAAGAEDTSALAGISRGLPEWQRAVKLQKRAARVGFDSPGPAPVIAKLHEEIDEVRSEFDALSAGDPDAPRRRDRRPAVRRGQPGAPRRRGCRQRAAPRQRQVRAAFPRHGSAGGRGTAAAVDPFTGATRSGLATREGARAASRLTFSHAFTVRLPADRQPSQN